MKFSKHEHSKGIYTDNDGKRYVVTPANDGVEARNERAAATELGLALSILPAPVPSEVPMSMLGLELIAIGVTPSVIDAIVAALPEDTDEQKAYKLAVQWLLSKATTCDRHHPLMTAIKTYAQMIGSDGQRRAITDADLDDVFRRADRGAADRKFFPR